MKSVTGLFLFLLIPLWVPSQILAQQAETLFDNQISHGGFGSLVFGLTSVNGQATYLQGTRGAWILRFDGGNSVQLGYGHYRIESDFDALHWNQPDVEIPELKTDYSGFEIEYLNKSHQLIHFGGQLLIGSGIVRYSDGGLDLNRTSDNYFVMQPGANIHLNVTNWFRLNGGIFYRHAVNVNLEGTSDTDLSGVATFLGLRFGKF